MNINSANFLTLHRKKFDIFKAQNPETGRFDVAFDFNGKMLYAHKTMLTLDSDTFNAMLSEIWTKKDEPIKIKDYSYDDFYQIFTFLYSAQCQLTDENIFSMVDIAEIYGVELFKDYCYNYLTRMKITAENIFKVMDLAEKFSITFLHLRVYDFIPNNFAAIIASDAFLKANKNVVKELVGFYKYIPEPEDLFRAVYKWSEKHAMDKQAADSNLNLQDAIKTEIFDFLPHILFRGMDSKFLQQFVVSRGFIFESWSEVSKIFADHDRFFEGKVKVTNANGQTLHGNVIPDKTVLRNIESLKLSKSTFVYFGRSDYDFQNWNEQFKLPSYPSPLQKRNGIEWYLCYFQSGKIGVQHRSNILESYYMLAGLTTGNTGFQLTDGCKIEIE